MKYLTNYVKTDYGYVINSCRMYDEDSPNSILEGFWHLTDKGWRSTKKVTIPFTQAVEIEQELQISEELAEHLLENYRVKYKVWADPNIDHSVALKHKALCEYISDPHDNR